MRTNFKFVIHNPARVVTYLNENLFSADKIDKIGR